jgi:hypothetical protein
MKKRRKWKTQSFILADFNEKCIRDLCHKCCGEDRREKLPLPYKVTSMNQLLGNGYQKIVTLIFSLAKVRVFYRY